MTALSFSIQPLPTVLLQGKDMVMDIFTFFGSK